MAKEDKEIKGGDVSPDEETVVEEVIPVTEASLMVDMDAAVKSGDYKAVAKIAKELVQFQKAKETAEADAKSAASLAIAVKVKGVIDTALQDMIDNGELDNEDGIWYTNDFGEKLSTCRTTKTASKAAKSGGNGGGGKGKKFDIGTEELLEKFGGQEFKDGKTFAEAYKSNTDKNWRYGIREKLLKLNGDIS